jgi:DNA-binding CsgD family transcriptional regulator
VKRDDLNPDVIAEIYAGAIEDGGLDRISEIVRATTGVDSAGVWVVDGGQIREMSLIPDLREAQWPYLAHFHKLDVWQEGIARFARDTAAIAYEHTPEREFMKTEFYNDFARPRGIHRPMGAMLQLTRDAVATIAVNQPEFKRPFERYERRRLQALVPHIKRALQLRLRQRRQVPPTSAQGLVLDALTFAVLVCDAGARVVCANVGAESLARAGKGIVLGGSPKRLGAPMSGEAHALAALIHDAAYGGSGGATRLTSRDGAKLLALVTPLPRGLGGLGGPGHALVALRAASDDPPFTQAMLCALFHLSPAQALIALAIYDGKTPEEIAASRGIRISTLRTHLTEIFLRTGVENQRDLVRLLGTLPQLRLG